ncbi:MerR family transcriptional regulator, partial [Escherichia coli]|nr:MerR family transcriptional regulator [Escherichia coli]
MMEWLRSEPSVACNTASKELLALKAAEIKQTIAHYTKIAALLEELPQIDEVQDYSTVQKDVNTFVEHIFTDIRKD